MCIDSATGSSLSGPATDGRTKKGHQMKETLNSVKFERDTLRSALNVHEAILSCMWDSTIAPRHYQAGPHRLSVYGIERAHGGVIVHSQRGENGRYYVVSTAWLETLRAKLAEYNFRHDDEDGLALRSLVNRALAESAALAR